MTLAPGVRLGPFEIVAAIGAGGMGEVYRARDTRLNRDVAIKVLPEAFAEDPGRLARFKREAQVLASVNHPNIASIYGLEDLSLVLEFVDGHTLADRIAQGPIPLEEASPIARQICEALEAAHEHGIVHRDLKPANIKLTANGTVKVLDFGLAKALDSNLDNAAAGFSQSPTLTSPAMRTGGGVILGTAPYMSPEQARGKAVDKRADIWAMGCVLFEMLTGTRAFEGDDVTDILANIVRGEPEWARLPSETPPGIRKLLRRCLEKDRKRRMSDAGDVRLELEEAPSEPAALTVPPPASRWRERAAWSIAALMSAVAAGVVAMNLLRPPAPPALQRMSILPPAGSTLLVNGGSVAVSPDLNNDLTYTRFNPLVGATYKVLAGLTLYGGYSESNRAPTPLELGCSNPNRPCLIESALVSDPPLNQVVSHTYEAGLRGDLPVWNGRVDWKVGAYRTDLTDDIITTASNIQGRGVFQNVAATRRQGIEAGAKYVEPRWMAYASYSFIDATYQFNGKVASPNNPFADANGDIFIVPGNKIPAIPAHQFKAGADVFVTPEWKIGADLAVVGSQYFVGDDGNQNPKVPAYWTTNLHTSYQVTKEFQVFGLITNVFNQRYYTYGTFFELDGVAKAVSYTFSDPRTVTPAQPLAFYGGLRVKLN